MIYCEMQQRRRCHHTSQVFFLVGIITIWLGRRRTMQSGMAYAAPTPKHQDYPRNRRKHCIYCGRLDSLLLEYYNHQNDNPKSHSCNFHHLHHVLRVGEWELQVFGQRRHIFGRRKPLYRSSIWRLDFDSRGYVRLQRELKEAPVVGVWETTTTRYQRHNDNPLGQEQQQHCKVLARFPPCFEDQEKQKTSTLSMQAEFVLCHWGKRPKMIRGLVFDNSNNRKRIIATFRGRGVGQPDTLDLMYPQRKLRMGSSSGLAY